MSVQTSYAYDGATAMAGMLGTAAPDKKVITRIAAEALDFGKFVIINADGEVELADDDSGNVAGVVMFEPTLAQRMDGGKPIQAKDPVNILRKGDIWVHSSLGASTPKDLDVANLHNDDTDATSQAKRGKVTAEAVSANVIRAVGGIRFLGTPTGTLALVEVDLPAGARGPTGPAGP